MTKNEGGDEEMGFKFNSHGDEHYFVIPALTKREWFAGMVLQGLLSAWTDNLDLEKRVALAYRYADRMLTEVKPDA